MSLHACAEKNVRGTIQNRTGFPLAQQQGIPDMSDNTILTIERRRLLMGAALVGGLATGAFGSVASVSAQGTSVLRPSTMVFDVNETLLDIEYLSPIFERVFGDRRVLREWFNQLILYSDAISLAGPYATFFSLGQGVLEMLGTIHNAKVGSADIDELRARLLTMPAHPDVVAGLRQLREAGFRLVSFTNSPPDPTMSPLKHAGIDQWFERSFSVDSVRRFKPAAQGYQFVAEQLDAPPSSLCMVAAHVWDTIGAQSAGYAAALIARPGNAPLPVHGLPQPHIVAPDLPGVATEAIRMWRS
jgi:2-haloacid dehalogenase